MALPIATSLKVREEIPHCPLSEDRTLVIAGDTVDEIVKTAEEINFNLIIMGTHGQERLTDMMLGSTASGVLLKSKVPVLVARPE